MKLSEMVQIDLLLLQANEQKIYLFIIQGRSNQYIEDVMHLANYSAATRISRLAKKLGVNGGRKQLELRLAKARTPLKGS